MAYLRSALLLILGGLLAVSLASGAWAQDAGDCQGICQKMQTDGSVNGPEEMEQCLDYCHKFKEAQTGVGSLRCDMDLAKACGFELAWDLIRYCAKPCIEFKKDACEDCLDKHSFCSRGTACRYLFCTCEKLSDDCDQWMNQFCK